MIKTIRSFALILALFLSPLFIPVAHASFAPKSNSINKYNFTTPAGLNAEVNFWKKIYSEYTTRHAVIHDMRNLGVVYEVVYLGSKPLSRRVKERKLDRKREKYKINLH